MISFVKIWHLARIKKILKSRARAIQATSFVKQEAVSRLLNLNRNRLMRLSKIDTEEPAFIWGTRIHVDIFGNELADKLAKRAAVNRFTIPPN